MNARVLFLLALASAGCARAAFDPAAEEAVLLKRDAEWSAAAAAAQDVEKIVSYWSDDAVVIPPGQPAIRGKAALRTFVGDSIKMPGFSIHWTSRKPSFSSDGKVAYMEAVNETTMRGPDGAMMTLPGRGVTVWRKGDDGQWRCVLDTWNEPPAR